MDGLAILPPLSAILQVPLLASVASTSAHIFGFLAQQSPHQSSPQIQCLFHRLWPRSKQCQWHQSVLAGSFIAEGLLSVQEKLEQKIVWLEFLELRAKAGDMVP